MDWLAVIVLWLVELTESAVMPNPLARRAELAIETAMRVRTTFIVQPFPALARRVSPHSRYST
ncbi:MAG TPA: hypothetical protein VMA72_14405 [Streptosporangiaceae bacterium]|nr:hypothetical protein [Streptosporangiaceae bacterium]